MLFIKKTCANRAKMSDGYEKTILYNNVITQSPL